MTTDVDIAIVGGGMAGGFLAAALADSGLSICVLDAAAPPEPPRGEAGLRVVALTEASHHMLVKTGVWERLEAQRLAPYEQMQVFDSDGTARLDFSAGDVSAQALGWIVENAHLQAAIYQRLATAEAVDWHANGRLQEVTASAEGWQLRLDTGDSLNCRLLVGADGANSFVRRRLGISASQRDSGHHAVVTRLSTEKPHGNCARQWFMSSGPLAFLPLFGDGHQVSIVWSALPDMAASLADLPLDELGERLTLASEGALGRVLPQQPAVRFPVRELHASRYVGRRLALVGDAAHVIHPLAGQGINLGLLDAGVLAEEILRAKEKAADWGNDLLLARYQRRRRGHNLLMQQSMRGFQTLFAQQSLPLRWLRNTGMKLVANTLPLKQQIIAEALGRHGDLPQLARPRP